KRPSFRNFAATFRGHWLEAMSGGFSVPFTALAVFSNQTYQQAIFAILAVAAIWFAAYRVWAAERRARNSAEGSVRELEDEYTHAIDLEKIDFAHPEKGDTVQFQPVFRNTLTRPIEYQVLRSKVNDKEGGKALASVISKNASSRFYMMHASLA